MKYRPESITLIAFAAICTVGAACSAPTRWQSAQSELPGAILSVWGTAHDDVYFAGADSGDGRGPTVIHFDGSRWVRVPTDETTGSLWWVQGLSSGEVLASGTQGIIVHLDRTTNQFVHWQTPDTESTLFGVWGATAADVWAVGARTAADGTLTAALWHFDGTQWENRSTMLPTSVHDVRLFKVWGRQANDVWSVGERGTALHWDGTQWTVVATGSTQRLLTVHGNADFQVAVGGLGLGVILEASGTTGWHDVSPPDLPGLNGVRVAASGSAIAVGIGGAVATRTNGTWTVDPEPLQTPWDLHSTWIDETGNVWAVGGQYATSPMTHGIIFHRGAPVPTNQIQ